MSLQSFGRWTSAVAAAGVASLMLAFAPAALAADGKIEFDLYKAGFIVGGSGGSGILTFKGNGYNLSVGGVSVGATIGVARAEFIGEVYNLKDAKDIEGTYTAGTASAAAGGGVGVTELQNSRGVRLRLQGRQIGLMVSIDLSGMQISIRN